MYHKKSAFSDYCRLAGQDCGYEAASFSTAAVNSTLFGQWQQLTAALLYYAAGCLCGMLLLRHNTLCCDSITRMSIWMQRHAVQEQLVWLMGAPAGSAALPR